MKDAGKRPYRPQSAQRYGGPNSPDGHDPTQRGADPRNALRLDADGKREMRFRKRSWLVLLCAAPLIASGFMNLFGGNAFGMARDFGLFGVFALSVWLVREGVAAEAAYLDRKFAAPPSIPRKLLGSLGIGAGLFATGLLGWDIGWLQSVGLGLLGAAAGVLSFGVDPMREKGELSIGGITHGEVTEAIREAEGKIDALERAAADVHDRPLRERLGDVSRSARGVLKRIEDDPSDLRRARKFLKVYLDGALDATRKYVRNQDDHVDSEMYLKFRSLLDDMKTTFDAQEEKLLKNDRIDLDVEIDVLADRLKQETAP